MNPVRDLTICLPYYENPGMLNRQYASLRALPSRLKAHVSLIVVDDGSPDHPIFPPSPGLGTDEFPFGRVFGFRMKEDIPWNQDACRNLAAHHALTEWLILTDIDHLIPAKTLSYALGNDLDPGVAYQFTRVSEPDMLPYKPHPNSWLMTRELYWKSGGYDERFARGFGQVWGIYGTDGRFRKQVADIAQIVSFKAALVRVPRDVTPDASTTRYDRRSADMDAKRTQVRDLIKNSDQRRPAVLTCDWERVF